MVKTFSYPKALDTGAFNHIKFYQRDKSRTLKNIFTFYVPQEYMIGDAANWNDTELGIYKGLIDKMTTSGVNAESINAGIKAVQAEKNVGVILAQTLGQGSIIGDVAEGIMRNEKIAVNPNLVLMYRGNGIRQFQFQFRMIASSEDEARHIEEIAHEFRAGSYGLKNGEFLLDYPDQFKFIYLAPGGTVNDFLPAPATLALNSVSMSNNPSSNLFHKGGAPIEVTLSLMFREIRSLNRDDINKLRNETQLQGGNSDFLRDDNTWLV
jgi:hypothetical protein